MMDELRNKKVLIIGLGRSGVAAAHYCVRAGAAVIAADAKPAAELGEALEALKGLPIRMALGGHDPALLLAVDLICVSPGVPLSLPGLLEAAQRGIPIVGELELALREINRPLIAVTGTNGKTTTTALIGHLLATAKIRACVAGNIGMPLLAAVEEARGADVIVLEISSFQIDTTPSLAAQIAVWLNATEDHLDRHGTFANYVASKARLFTRAPADGFGIYNAADAAVAEAVRPSRCQLIPFDATGRRAGARPAPDAAEGDRAWYAAGDLWIKVGGEAAHRYGLADVQLFGLHNRENMLAALAACELAGAEPAALAAGLATFRGLPHRVAFVRELRGVRYYDDSKGTNVGATIRALEGFAEPVVLIAGGLGKGADFAPLGPLLRERVKRLVLIGQAADEMEQTLGASTATARAGSMDEAVRMAAAAAAPGDVVLLSPACASFDMFKDYADRGDAFVQAVERLAAEGEKAKR
jgi:UDP-N-acetylmuramoylalanine--D-glutamate ligase